MAWRLEKHDEYMPEDWGIEPIRLVDDEGKTVADNSAFYPHALTREHADAILAMQARLAAPQPALAVKGLNERIAFEDWALADHRDIQPNQDEERHPGNYHYYECDSTNNAYIGWCERSAVASPPPSGEVEALREAANIAFDEMFKVTGAPVARAVQQKILALAALSRPPATADGWREEDWREIEQHVQPRIADGYTAVALSKPGFWKVKGPGPAAPTATGGR